MKFSTLSIAALATAATVSATITINEPWGETTWTAGGNATVAWNSTADDAGKLCEIHLLTGEATAATFVANLTANGNLVPCNYTRANLHPLPDYAAGNYFVRMGENGGSMDLYSYSGYFKYEGNGTVLPETLSTTPAAPAAPATDATTADAATSDAAATDAAATSEPATV